MTPQRILLATWGTTGDIAPYTGLAARLRDAGHQVTVVTSRRYASLFLRHRLRVRAMPLDDHEAAVGTHRSRRARVANAREMALIAAEVLLDTAGEGTDVLLAHPLMHPQAAVIGEGLQLPCIGLYTVSHAMMLPRLIAGTPRQRYTLADASVKLLLSSMYRPAIARLRRELGLPHRLIDDTLTPAARHTVYYGFSSALLPTRLPLPPTHKVVGNWQPAPPPAWRPDARLSDFLTAGPAPVYFGFGSVGGNHAERLSDAVTRTVRRLKIRAVVQGGWAGVHGHGDDILNIGECPHTWLFPRVSVAVHHAGSGTTHACLHAATPALPVPEALDQPFWAARLHTLGLTPTAVPMHHLTADNLTDALTRLLTEGQYRERTRHLSNIIGQQDGTAAILRALSHTPA